MTKRNVVKMFTHVARVRNKEVARVIRTLPGANYPFAVRFTNLMEVNGVQSTTFGVEDEAEGLSLIVAGYPNATITED